MKLVRWDGAPPTSAQGGKSVEQMLTTRELAEALGVHPNWVYVHAAQGDLPSYKVAGAWRFLPTEIATWLAGGRPANSTGHVHRAHSRRRARHGR
jgi:excisionase family DNA binding protein